MNLEDHLRRRLPHTAPLRQCECCRRALRPDEYGRRVCVDCCGISGVVKAWRADRRWTGWGNAALDGLSTPIGELPEVISERRARNLELIALLDKWINEPGDEQERSWAALSKALGYDQPVGEWPELSTDSRQLPSAVPDYAGEIARITPDAATLSKLAAANPPPQSWYDETDDPTKIPDESGENPFARVKLNDEQLDALAELIRKT